MRLVAVALLAACHGRARVASCGDDLAGVWRTGDARWVILDHHATVEAYPLFDDAVPPAGAPPELVVAPRVIDLHRVGDQLAGDVNRRYMRRADSCDARAPIHVTACAADTLEVVVAEVAPPVTFGPCSWPPPAGSRAERWHRLE